MSSFSPLSMYTASVPVFSAMLKNLARVLDHGEKSAAERKIDPSTLLNARLAPDMFALTRQVQIATDHAKGASSRLAGREVPKMEDNEKSFAELQERIEKVRKLMKDIKPEEFEGADTREVVIRLPQRELRFTGIDYLQRYAIPNFYFHVTTPYLILRHNGVPVGKTDFLGG
ncbi:MAG: DUF1993 domain-containing protein [Rhizobiaceae bacterium]